MKKVIDKYGFLKIFLMLIILIMILMLGYVIFINYMQDTNLPIGVNFYLIFFILTLYTLSTTKASNSYFQISSLAMLGMILAFIAPLLTLGFLDRYNEFLGKFPGISFTLMGGFFIIGIFIMRESFKMHKKEKETNPEYRKKYCYTPQSKK